MPARPCRRTQNRAGRIRLHARSRRRTRRSRRQQHADGHWVFELEADATIPAEYVLLEHFLDRIEPELEAKIGVYLRSIQGAHGGWPLFHDGAFNLSASVKAYFALQGDRRRSGRAAHGGVRASDPGGRRRRTRATSSPAPSSRCSARCRGARCR